MQDYGSCRFAFDADSKCMTVACSGCIGALTDKKVNRCPTKYLCGKRECSIKYLIEWIGKMINVGNGIGHHLAQIAKGVTRGIADDRNKREINKEDPEFKDLLFHFTLSCMACNRFL